MGFDGERDKDCRISRMEAKPSIDVVWTCVGESRCAALPGEWRGEYSNSITARSLESRVRGKTGAVVVGAWGDCAERLLMRAGIGLFTSAS